MEPTWSADRRLDILVLGPMGAGEAGLYSNIPIQRALEELLLEQPFADLLEANGVTDAIVTAPDRQDGQDIVQAVLRLIDETDLVVFNVNRRPNGDRANVFYELGIVNALGIPVMLVHSAANQEDLPFYVRMSRVYTASDFEIETLKGVFRAPLSSFLDAASSADFRNDRVTQFYGMPIVDISAAAGLAVGYYRNFFTRLINERGFISHYPGAIQAVVYVRPSSLRATYEADKERLRAGLSELDLRLERRNFPPILSDQKGEIWFDHVGGVAIDIPRAIYQLHFSPRLFAFMQRGQALPPRGPRVRAFERRRLQIEEALMDRVEVGVRNQIRQDGTRVRSSVVYYTTLDDAPALIQQLVDRDA